MILHLSEGSLLLNDPTLQLTQKISDSLVFGLINQANRLELMRLMLSEHLAFATCRFVTILTEVVQTYPVLFAFLALICTLKDEADYVGKLIDEATAMGQLSFDDFSAIWALRFHLQASSDAELTVYFGAMRTKSWLIGPAIADLAVDQFLVLLLRLIQFAWVFLRRWLKHHYNITSNQTNRQIDINHSMLVSLPSFPLDQSYQIGGKISYLLLKFDLNVLSYCKPNIDYLSLLEIEVIPLHRICIFKQFSLSLHNDLVGMEVNSIDEEGLIPAHINCFLSFSDLFLLGLPHHIIRGSRLDAEVIDMCMILLSVALI